MKVFVICLRLNLPRVSLHPFNTEEIATPVLIKKPVDNNFNLTFDAFCKNRNKLAVGDYLDGEYYSLVSQAVMSNKNVHPDILAKYPDAIFIPQYRKRRYFYFIGNKTENKKLCLNISHLVQP